MAPHCDTLDGPVVKACQLALETGNVNYVLPFVGEKSEKELKQIFDKTMKVRESGPEVAEVADLWFFENSVRLHRESEGKPYTGLKAAGLDWGPVVPLAENDIEEGDPSETIDFLKETLQDVLEDKFLRATSLKNRDKNDVRSSREYTQAMLDFVLFSHHLYKYMTEDETGIK
ncbi:DUF6448 family protein [Methanobacterium movens]|nr:MAG: hypothetical protein CIT03_07615 [Methanobacterium sp.]